MRRFGYLRDGLFLGACGLYALNRLLVKPLAGGGVFAWWFNDFGSVLNLQQKGEVMVGGWR